MFILCPVLAGGAAFGVSKHMTPIYEGTSVLVINQNASTSDSLSSIQAAQQLVVTYSKIVTTRPIMEATIAQLHLNLTTTALAHKITVTPVAQTQLIDVSVDDPDPQMAANIANAVSKQFIDSLNAQSAQLAGLTKTQIANRIGQIQAQISSESAKIAQLQDGPNAGSATIQSQISQLRTQLAQDQATYTSLVEAQQQTDLNLAQSGSQIRVVEPAMAPTSPVKPRVMFNTAIAVVLGLFIAGGLVLLFGYLDDTVKRSDDVKRLTKRPAIGMIPLLRSPSGVEAVAHPGSEATEAYRTMRTNFQFMDVERDIHSLVMTSSRPGDGKTTTAVNLATVLAQGGLRVILVDADLRKPQIHNHFNGLTIRTGLTNLLLGTADASLTPLLRQTNIPGLRILPSGPLPPNPPDVLNSTRMKQVVSRLEAEADLVIFDAPPIAVSDALIMAGLVSRSIVVVLSGRTRINELEFALQELSGSGNPVAGVVINRVKWDRGGSYEAYYKAYGTGESKVASALEPEDVQRPPVTPSPNGTHPNHQPSSNGASPMHNGHNHNGHKRAGFATRLFRRSEDAGAYPSGTAPAGDRKP